MPGLGKYSIGIGDRFGRQGTAQLRALVRLREDGVAATPVWNKSHREHCITGTVPADVRRAADAAVRTLNWPGAWFVDADHVNLQTVAPFIPHSDFFTLDIADAMGRSAAAATVDAFAAAHPELTGTLDIPGLPHPVRMPPPELRRRARRILAAVSEAAELYRFIRMRRGADDFVTEVSMDETDTAQSPPDLLIALAALADAAVPVRTLAPKFSGRFNKGVDYAGDVEGFVREFEADLCVLRWCRSAYPLPPDLKLSIHTGSDKFSLYGPIADLLRAHGEGVHLKTAGTTWLEEIIGLAESGDDGVALVRDLYRRALGRFEEMCAPYAQVVDIDRARLPDPDTLSAWTGEGLAAALRHQPGHPRFNPHLRQFLHVAFKVAAEMGARYLDALDRHAAVVHRQVETNLYERHLKPLFGAMPSCDT